ncbi:carbohydrate esterase family 8 protein [Flammula alnicola]|nr:carbohydrate esterase family 8 protein [Flammula alnicola]
MTFSIRFILISVILALCESALGASRTTPPAGAVIVRAGTTTAGEFSTVSKAVNSLPNDSSTRTIFIFPGTYTEQVNITRPGPLTMYNVNVKNTFGQGSQAIAISQYGTRVGLYGCGFFGFQDTVLAEQGTQVFLRGYIQGATDFIFGQRGQAYFERNTIAVSAHGCITASGRTSNDNTSYVFNDNTVVLSSGAASDTAGRIFLGRPWGDFAKVIFKNTVVNVALNTTVWSIWNVGDERTDDVFFADFNTTGSGIAGAKRASFSTLLSASQASAFSISSAVGSDFATWVDTTYLA